MERSYGFGQSVLWFCDLPERATLGVRGDEASLAVASSSFPVLTLVVLLGQVNMLQGALVTSSFEI